MKRAISVAATLLVAAVLAGTSLPATAVPQGKAIIEDPLGDANFINDQGTGDGSFGDFNQADAGTVSDLLVIRVANDAKKLYVTFENEAAPPAATGIGFRLRVNPDGAGGAHCLLFEAYFPGANNDLTQGVAQFRDACEGGDATELELLGTTLVIPRNLSKAFGKGAKLTSPQAQSFLWNGSYPTGAAGPTVDTTKVGTDYKFVDKK